MKTSFRTKKIILFLIFVLLVTSGFGCAGTPAAITEATKPVNLVYWRVFDDQDSMDRIISDYQALHPYVSITYRKLRYEEYERQLLNALAEDRGPDIFSLHNTWIKKYQSKLAPLPKTTTMAFETIQGTLQKQKVYELRTANSLNLRDLKTNFVDAVSDDAVSDSQIYGLPLALDTMVLFYNKDLLNNAGIPQPPVNWTDFRNQVKKLTKQDQKGNIIQAGAAIGTSKNINRSFDLLSLLMMQNGTVMADDNGYPKFGEIPQTQQDRSYVPAEAALSFYTDFASPSKEVYTWNDQMPNSLEAFLAGNVAFYFGYSYDITTIKNQAPKLNWAITTMPQLEGSQVPTNYANYWLETVSKKSQHINEAWDFLQFATRAENASKYLAITGKPTALRSLINNQLGDINLNPFASQVLTARSWYKGADPLAAEDIFGSIIDSVIQGTATPHEAISLAVSRVAQTISPQQ